MYTHLDQHSLDEIFLEALQHRFCRERKLGILEDIYDGVVYQEQGDFFENKFHISFAFNFDGALASKSSKMQLWPVQLYVNELPPQLRLVNT